MFNKKNKELESRLLKIVDALETHEKQHTREHWLVIALLSVAVTLQMIQIVL